METNILNEKQIVKIYVSYTFNYTEFLLTD